VQRKKEWWQRDEGETELSQKKMSRREKFVRKIQKDQRAIESKRCGKCSKRERDNARHSEREGG